MDKSMQSRKVILAASTGGHLAQLNRMAHRFNPSDDSLWITFDTPQSRSLLEGRQVLYLPYIAPRDVLGTVRAAWQIARKVDLHEYALAVSTGAALAVGILPIARACGVPAMYVESVSRFDGPSLTGKLLAASRIVELRTQHASWSGGRWKPVAPVLQEFAMVAAPKKANPTIFVTLGTISPYRFDALVDGLLKSGLPDSRTIWQLGCTHRSDLPGKQVQSMSATEFERASREADLVVTHAGVGTILQLLEWGISPVVVPRRRSRNEHVDDHQLEISRYLAEVGLGTVLDARDLTAESLVSATASTTRLAASPAGRGEG